MTSIIEKAMAPKSDQLNADDLIVGSIDVTIVDVTESGEGKIAVHIGQGRQPWKPCKGMLRLLTFCWGNADPETWKGRSVRLYRDPNVKYGGDTLGGIRVSHASHITQPFTTKITVARNKRETVTVLPLTSKKEKPVSLLDSYRKQMKGQSAPVLALGKKIAEAFAANDATAFDSIEAEISQIEDAKGNDLLKRFLSDVLKALTEGGAA